MEYMDKAYLKQICAMMEVERALHGHKFADQPLHQNCLMRFDKVIASLKKNLDEKPPRMDFSISESALPDAIEEARALKYTADAIRLDHRDAASFLMNQALEVVMKELNELDGFDR